jgi:hypothetical protein
MFLKKIFFFFFFVCFFFFCSYKVAVKATNSAGQESDPAFSAAILMDVTPPEGIACSRFRLATQAALSRDATDQSSFSSRPVVYSKSLTFTTTQHQLLKVILMFGL